MSPDILKETFVFKASFHNLRRKDFFKNTPSRISLPRPAIVIILDLEIWNLVLTKFKEQENLEIFKLKIKKWIHFECRFRLCCTYI